MQNAVQNCDVCFRFYHKKSELALNSIDPISSLAPNSFTLFFETSIADNFIRD